MKDEQETPSYYATIPAKVRYDKNLTANEKLLYGEITCLSNKHGFCFASNKYFSKLYFVHKNTISKWIANLKKYGHIVIKITYKKDSKQVDKRHIYISDRMNTPINEKLNTPINEKLNTPINEKLNTPINEKLKDNTINNNNINNNSKEKGKKKKDPPIEYPSNLDLVAWKLWLKHKAEIKSNYQPTGLQSAIKKLCKLPTEKQLACIEYSVSNGYKGFFPENFNNENKTNEKFNNDNNQKTKQRETDQRENECRGAWLNRIASIPYDGGTY